MKDNYKLVHDYRINHLQDYSLVNKEDTSKNYT